MYKRGGAEIPSKLFIKTRFVTFIAQQPCYTGLFEMIVGV